MQFDRPNLGQVSPEVLTYLKTLEAEIEDLEAELARLRSSRQAVKRTPRTETEVDEPPLEPSEPPTTLNLITISASGLIKPTPRHLYQRQRRAAWGFLIWRYRNLISQLC